MERLLELSPILFPAALGFAALFWLLPRPRPYPALLGAFAAALALVMAGGLLIQWTVVSVELVLFYAFSGIAVTAGGLLLTQRRPARAALAFALVVLSTCGLFLLQGAPFLMSATVIIYAGAIIVTFLFVIMLAQQEGLSDADQRSREPFLACVAGFVLVVSLLYVLKLNYAPRALDLLLARLEVAAGQPSVADAERALGGEDRFFADLRREVETLRGVPDKAKLLTKINAVPLDWVEWKEKNEAALMRERLKELADLLRPLRGRQGAVSPAADAAARAGLSVPPLGSTENVAPLGRSLFTDYLLAVELGGMLLLVATIGAIAIAATKPRGEHSQPRGSLESGSRSVP